MYRAKLKYTRREMMAMSSAIILSSCQNKKSQSKKPNFIVYLPDAMRADRLGCYGSPVPVTPVMDRFSQNSFIFENCYSQAPWTKPSVAALFSGFLPRTHMATISHTHRTGIDDVFRVQVLRDSFTTMAETFKSLGYNTARFLCNPNVQNEYGFGQGFDHYHYEVGIDPPFQMRKAISWIKENKDQPFFLFVHASDPHGPYVPLTKKYEALFKATPEEHMKKLSEKDQSTLKMYRWQYYQDNPQATLTDLSDEGREYLLRLYDAEIHEVDYTFGLLIDYLKKQDLYEKTAIALISDHGEAFGEHDFFGHGKTLYSEELHVPLILKVPEHKHGKHVPWSVSLFDLFPTLISLAGATPPAGIQAKALLSEQGSLLVSENRTVFSYIDYWDPDTRNWDISMTTGSQKVISYNRRKRYALFDLEADPGEKNNLLNEDQKRNPAESEIVQKLIQEKNKHIDLAESFGEPEWTEAGEKMKEELEALGYL